jgi:monoamine oxidase
LDQQFEDGKYADLGGTFFNDAYVRLKELIQSYDLHTRSKCNDSLAGQTAYNSFYADLHCGTRRSSKNASPIQFRCVLAKLDWNHFVRQLDRIANQMINYRQSWDMPNACELDNCTMEQFIDRELTNTAAKRAARTLVAINTCAEPSQVSLLWFAWLVRGWGGMCNLIGMGPAGNEQRVTGAGLSLLIERLARDIKEVKLHQPVVGIDHSSQSVICRLNNFSLLWAKKVLFAVPISALSKVHFNPPLPTIQSASKKLPMGSCIKFVVRYKSAFWNEYKFSGQLLVDCDLGVLFTYEDSDSKKESYGLLGFAVANAANKLSVMTESDRNDAILSALADAMKDERFKDKKEMKVMDWSQSSYIGGGHNSYAVPSFLTNERR